MSKGNGKNEEKASKGTKPEPRLKENVKVALVRVRGQEGLKYEIKDTLNMLNLSKKNFCTVITNTPSMKGMINKIKDYVTYGEIDSETYKLLIEKRGVEYTGPETDSKGKIKYKRFITEGEKKIKKYFRLNSPKKGYGRKGIKWVFSKGGALGYRGAKINDLIKRMV